MDWNRPHLRWVPDALYTRFATGKRAH